MRAVFRAYGAGLVAVALTAGCNDGASDPPAADVAADVAGADASEAHAHDGDDVLFWEREGIEAEGYQIQLGHHGVNINAGHSVEPAVSISRDGEPVADAKVFNSLVSDDGQQVLVDEVATVYEPPTAEEPAHYAQGGLDVPQGLNRAVIRYRIVLPGEAGEVTYNVKVAVQDH